MIREFMEYYDQANVLRRQLEIDISKMNRNYNLATLESDEAYVLQALQASAEGMHVTERRDSVMGTTIPKYKLTGETRQQYHPVVMSSHYRIDKVADMHPTVKMLLVELAEVEKTCFILGAEIKATRRRVNALEHKTIPDIEETITYIKLRLDDQVRSQQARIMKVTKK